jgi:vacuolar-type H+-ATPase subunit I/STV1
MTNIETVLEILKPRPSFWLRAWLFFFLLINRKEGKRLIETLIEKVDEVSRKAEEVHRKVEAYAEKANRELKEADRKLKEARERAG